MWSEFSWKSVRWRVSTHVVRGVIITHDHGGNPFELNPPDKCVSVLWWPLMSDRVNTSDQECSSPPCLDHQKSWFFGKLRLKVMGIVNNLFQWWFILNLSPIDRIPRGFVHVITVGREINVWNQPCVHTRSTVEWPLTLFSISNTNQMISDHVSDIYTYCTVVPPLSVHACTCTYLYSSQNQCDHVRH